MKIVSHALLALALVTPAVSQAAIIQFDLIGTAGAGLLPGNEPGAITGGTGGEIGAGIFYDNVSNLLTLNVGWGSSQGFVDLSSAANNSHLHGPTASVNGNGFTEVAGAPFTLTRSSNLVTGGTITSGPLTLSEPQELALLDGKFYINIHTVNNGGGELRGFLVPAAIPEPSSFAALAGFAGLGLAALRRRQRA
ncbi:MAG: CHRD domain-containing protein [Burkholderiales bacterium]|nr:CHRD domain-containing protein [Opitutaceae bacterium]